MLENFKNALELWHTKREKPSMSTGYADLDVLIGRGIELGTFYLFYGYAESGCDLLVHKLLVNCLLPIEKGGFNGKAVYINCGNYREEKTLLDTSLIASIAKSARLDPREAFNNIFAVCAFSQEQEEGVSEEVKSFLKKDGDIRLVVVHNIAKLFSGERSRMSEIPRLEKIIGTLWRATSENDIAFVVSCRPARSPRGKMPLPEGRKYLRHVAGIIVYLRKVAEGSPFISAYLVKHPTFPPQQKTFQIGVG